MQIDITILVGFVSALISALATYFIRNVAENNRLKEVEKKMLNIVNEAMLKHEQIHHKAETISIVKESILEHEKHCKAPEKIELIFQELKEMRTALVVLVSRNSGDPKELGLIR